MIDAEHLKIKAVPQKENTLALKDGNEEKCKIERALMKAGHNLSKAAEILGISRPTLYKKMDAYNLK